MAPKPMVICNEIAVRSKWTLANTANGSAKYFLEICLHIKLDTDVDYDINIPFRICAKDNGHL